MIAAFWRRAPWWMAVGSAILALSDFQSGVVGKAVTLAAMAIGLAGALMAPWADALLLLLAVSLFPGDIALLGAMLALLFRSATSGSLRYGGSLRSLVLVGFFISAAASAAFGLIAVEMRPLQLLLWTVTLGAPLLLLGGACPRLPDNFASLLSRFLISVLWVQVPVCAFQLFRHGTLEAGDWFGGTWENSNLVALWGAITLSVGAVRLLTGTTAVHGTRAWIAWCGHFAAAAFLVWGASAKLYSASILGAAGVVSVMVLVAGTGVSRIPTLFRSSAALVVILLAGILSESWVRYNVEGFWMNWEISEKRVLLERVVFDVGERYNAILGVGPGMLGSRAASAASGDFLYKQSETPFAGLLRPAPKPERWAMQDLWDTQVAETIPFRSAMLAMPFSGWASLRAELGWPAVILFLLYLASLSRHMAHIAMRYPGARSVGLAAAIGCVTLVPMLLFDNVLEQPHFMAPLCMLVMAARGVAGLRDDRRAAGGGVRAATFVDPVSRPLPRAPLPGGTL